jgi:hypothetical protein
MWICIGVLVQSDPLLGWQPSAAKGSAQNQPQQPPAQPQASTVSAACAYGRDKRRRVEERQASALTYAQFVSEFMEPNRPVLIKVCDGGRVWHPGQLGAACSSTQSEQLVSCTMPTDGALPCSVVTIRQGGASGWPASQDWVARPEQEPDIDAIEQAAGGQGQGQGLCCTTGLPITKGGHMAHAA